MLLQEEKACDGALGWDAERAAKRGPQSAGPYGSSVNTEKGEMKRKYLEKGRKAVRTVHEPRERA